MTEVADLERRIESLEAALGNRLRHPIRAMIAFVAFQTGISAAEIIGDGRARRLFWARAAVAWTARTVNATSTTRIGAMLGDRDHTTIIHALRRAEAMRARDPAFRALTNRMLDHFTREELAQ